MQRSCHHPQTGNLRNKEGQWCNLIVIAETFRSPFTHFHVSGGLGVAQLPHLLEEAGKSASWRCRKKKVAPFCKTPHGPKREKKAHHISSGVSMQPRIPHRTGTVRLMEAHDASEHEGGAEPYNMRSSCVIFIYGIHYSFPLVLVFYLSELNTGYIVSMKDSSQKIPFCQKLAGKTNLYFCFHSDWHISFVL